MSIKLELQKFSSINKKYHLHFFKLGEGTKNNNFYECFLIYFTILQSEISTFPSFPDAFPPSVIF